MPNGAGFVARPLFVALTRRVSLHAIHRVERPEPILSPVEALDGLVHHHSRGCQEQEDHAYVVADNACGLLQDLGALLEVRFGGSLSVKTIKLFVAPPLAAFFIFVGRLAAEVGPNGRVEAIGVVQPGTRRRAGHKIRTMLPDLRRAARQRNTRSGNCRSPGGEQRHLSPFLPEAPLTATDCGGGGWIGHGEGNTGHVACPVQSGI